MRKIFVGSWGFHKFLEKLIYPLPLLPFKGVGNSVNNFPLHGGFPFTLALHWMTIMVTASIGGSWWWQGKYWTWYSQSNIWKTFLENIELLWRCCLHCYATLIRMEDRQLLLFSFFLLFFFFSLPANILISSGGGWNVP